MRLLTRLAILTAAAAIIPACGGSSGGEATPGVLNGLKIVSRGGRGLTGAGGNGGMWDLQMQTMSDVRLLRSGTVDTTVVVPSIAPDLGANPLTVNSDMTLTPTAGIMVNNILGKDGINPATGLRVNAGATLTINPNYDVDNADGDGLVNTGTFERAYLGFTDGVVIEGTLTVGRKDGSVLDAAELFISAGSLVVASGGRIDTSGLDGAAGSNGGAGARINTDLAGSLVNAGTIDATGGDGDNGGGGGFLNLWADYAACNTGSIVSSGGTGSNGTGGSAGRLMFCGSQSSLNSFGGAFNLGSLTTRGGEGTSGGGNGGQITPSGYFLGAVVNTGTMDTSGGSATLSGGGGNAGDMSPMAFSGSIRFVGSLIARGGQGAGAGNGGNGGNIGLDTTPDSFVVSQEVTGGMYLGCAIDNSGGDGAAGGRAGRISITNDAGGQGGYPGYAPFVMVGYDSIDTSGGDGATDGGHANWGAFGVAYIEHIGNVDDNGNRFLGSILNEIDWIARGGNGTTGAGGMGASFRWRIRPSTLVFNVPPYDRSITNRGMIDTSGGDGATSGGAAGDVYLYDYFKVVNTGAIIARGGTGGSGAGGMSEGVIFESDDVVINSASIVADGGASGSGSGGASGNIGLRARSTSTAGNLSAQGGGSATGAGGNGATIEMFSTEDGTVKSGTFTVAGGSGVPAGTDGDVLIDGIDVKLTNGTIGF